MLMPRDGACCLCARAKATPAVAVFTDTLGYTYPLCERHYRPLAVWRKRRFEQEYWRERRRRAAYAPERGA